MKSLSINVNKIATLRNSRGENTPCLLSVVEDLISWGVRGITVHPRPDGRHILYSDVENISSFLKKTSQKVELNIEGYPSLEFLDLIEKNRPHQCTLVPDDPSVLTSREGWDTKKHFSLLQKTLERFHSQGVRSSLFIDPLKEVDLEGLKKLQPHRVEFYTGQWAKEFQTPAQASKRKKILQTYKDLSEKINALQIGINAGHDLNQKNLRELLQGVPLIQEVSIGHAFVCESLYEGFEKTLNRYFSIFNSL